MPAPKQKSTESKSAKRKCSAPGCKNFASVEVLLYDVYLSPGGGVFSEQDYTCPFLCEDHMIENEEKIQGERRPRRTAHYLYTNKHGAQGFTIYQNLSDEQV